jgi:hypothetical protein
MIASRQVNNLPAIARLCLGQRRQGEQGEDGMISAGVTCPIWRRHRRHIYSISIDQRIVGITMLRTIKNKLDN